MDTTLILLGVVCIIAAIIGGGVKAVQVELGAVNSLKRQLLLASFGIILMGAGLVMGGKIKLPAGGSATAASAAPQPLPTLAVAAAPAPSAAKAPAPKPTAAPRATPPAASPSPPAATPIPTPTPVATPTPVPTSAPTPVASPTFRLNRGLLSAIPSRSIAAAAPVDPATCISGYVWREAYPGDRVCVTPQRRAETADDNRAAASRRNPAGAYGPNTCVSGYVWREARAEDLVCVIPERRAQARDDNSQAAARRVN